jgi:hypothetical protein
VSSNDEAKNQGLWFRKSVVGDDLQGSAFSYADSLWNSATEVDRRNRHLKQACQYLGRAVLSLTDFESVPNAIPSPAPSVRTPRNLTRALVDTAMSQFAKTETRAQFLTDGGTPGQQEEAETRTDAANALMVQTGFEQAMRKAALHACLFDLGCVKFVEAHDGPRAEHVFAWETMFDPVDGRRGKTIRVQRFTADKDALISDFASEPDLEKPDDRWDRLQLIEDIRDSSAGGLSTSDYTLTDQHCVGYELWRLPVGKMSGRHVIVTDKALILDEEWTAKTFPFCDFGWSEDPLGPYPIGIAEINTANQDELDGVGRRISQILRQCAIPRYIEQGNAGDTVSTQIRGGEDAIGDIITVPPGKTLTAVSAGSMVGPELFQHEDRVWSRGFQQAGINEQSASGTRPAGLNSAPSQREWNEIRQDRLALVALDYQQAHVDGAEQLLEIVAKMPDYEINVKDPNGRWFKKLKASELNLQDSDVVIVKYPISALPSTPTGKLAAAADLLQMGALDKDDFKEIVQLPDLKSKLNIQLASRRATEKIIGKMLKTRHYEAPSERLDLGYALEYATAQWLNGIADEMPEDQLTLLNDWINDCISLQKAAQPAAAPGGAPAGPGGGAPLAGTSLAPITPQPLAAPVSSPQFGAAMAGAA